MNPQTGEIRQMTAEDLKKADGEWLQIDPNRMTRKQRRAMRVSLSDHTSALGKLATATRQQRRHAQQAAEYEAGVAKQGKRYIKGFHNNPKGLPHIGAKQLAKMARQKDRPTNGLGAAGAQSQSAYLGAAIQQHSAS